jgi:predicted dehydrogenase
MHGRTARRVFASFARSPGQKLRPAMLAQVAIEFDDAQATLSFDGATPYGPEDRTYVRGTDGTLVSIGPDCKKQSVKLFTSDGVFEPPLVGCWFSDGFHGTMGELLCAIEEKREPTINARDNLRSLALCLAAVASAETGQPMVPGSVRRMPE